MKQRFILSLFTILLVAIGVTHAEIAYSGKRIVFEGEIGTETSRSISIIPIEATISEDCIINVVFLKPIGDVQMLVDGKVEQTLKVTTVGQEIELSVVDLAPGTYKLEFRTPDGKYVYGKFVIE